MGRPLPGTAEVRVAALRPGDRQLERDADGLGRECARRRGRPAARAGSSPTDDGRAARRCAACSSPATPGARPATCSCATSTATCWLAGSVAELVDTADGAGAARPAPGSRSARSRLSTSSSPTACPTATRSVLVGACTLRLGPRQRPPTSTRRSTGCPRCSARATCRSCRHPADDLVATDVAAVRRNGARRRRGRRLLSAAVPGPRTRTKPLVAGRDGRRQRRTRSIPTATDRGRARVTTGVEVLVRARSSSPSSCATNTPTLLRTAYLLTGSGLAAEELVQDTLVRLFPSGTASRPPTCRWPTCGARWPTASSTSAAAPSGREFAYAERARPPCSTQRHRRAGSTTATRSAPPAQPARAATGGARAALLRGPDRRRDRRRPRLPPGTVRSLISRGLAALRADLTSGKGAIRSYQRHQT